jgi:predicted Zn-dependent peptidase
MVLWLRLLVVAMLLVTQTVTQPARAETLAPPPSIQPYLDRVIKNVTEFKLDNGLKFIVLERHEAPVVSFMTYADVGGVDEPDGSTGIAHFLEHLAFKGTQRIGSTGGKTDYAQEKALLDKSDQTIEALKQAQAKLARLSTQFTEASPKIVAVNAEIKTLTAEFEATELAAQKFVDQNKFGQLVERSGGTGLNANTSAEATRYFYSFPANKLELWMSLESERFLEPVFREFYKEKEIILEERRLRTENSPVGQLIEAFGAKAFTKHPYKRPVIGYVPDLRSITRPDVQKFFDTYYVPSNLTIAIVGDVKASEVKRMAQDYFGRFPKRPDAPEVKVVEPPQLAGADFTLELNSQPWYLEGYHRPAVSHPDTVVYDAISSILTGGRTSRLYRKLVQTEKVALNAESFNGFPGDKFPNLIMFYGLSAPGHGLDEMQRSIQVELDRLKTEPVSALELDRVKTQARAGLLRSLDSNSGMASALIEYDVKTGGWRNLFKQLDQIAAITPADIQRVAQQTFVPTNRTIGRIVPKK